VTQAAEDRELDGLLAAVRCASGVDFSRYARTTVRRRVRDVAVRHGADVAALSELARVDPVLLGEVVDALCVCVTSMFRDAEMFASYRALALPHLRAGEPLRVWHAGCGTGEEVWSHAVVLEEEGLGAHARLYGTDLSRPALARAQAGLLPLDRMREYTETYLRAGGRAEFSSYYAVHGQAAVVCDRIRARAVFGRHDLAADPPLGTFDVVFCRNVLMYFEPALQDRVHAVVAESLRPGGILVLGRGEALRAGVRAAYEDLDDRSRIYRRRASG
jgi:chemotaxis protein methyltransferase CheR